MLGLLQWILRVICCLIDFPNNRKPYSWSFLLFVSPVADLMLIMEAGAYCWITFRRYGLPCGEEIGFERTMSNCAGHHRSEREHWRVPNFAFQGQVEIVQRQSEIINCKRQSCSWQNDFEGMQLATGNHKG